jgi:hypothetical protein
MKIQTLLKGAYDLHVHAAPDVVARRQDLAALARQARAAGLAGVALKDHTTSTTGRVFTVNRFMEEGPLFYSCLALNPPVGGLNPTAVESALLEGATFVYFPTYGARNHIGIWGLGKPPTAFPAPQDYGGISLHREDGSLRPEIDPILDLVARYDAVLATGHLSPDESLSLLERAVERGVRRLLLTHVSEPVTAVPLEMQRQAVSLGALVEHCFFALTPACPGAISLERMRDLIEAVGPDAVILSSDFGQVHNPDPVEGFAHYLERLHGAGMGLAALRTMICDNPRRLLLREP